MNKGIDLRTFLLMMVGGGSGSGKVTEGYLYLGSFYKDSAHTELITPVRDCLYIDLTNGTGTLYFYNGSAYVGVGGGSITTDKFLSGWDCSTGQPISFPHSTPYTYETGMHFKVGAVASGSGTNYKPNGATYDGTASTTPETNKVLIGDFYFYDGSVWVLLVNTEHIRDVKVNGVSVVDANGDANIPLASTSSAGAMSAAQNDKLAGIEAGADVTDSANVAAAGAVMFTSQSKTAEEKEQARANIGAITLIPRVSGQSYASGEFTYVAEV